MKFKKTLTVIIALFIIQLPNFAAEYIFKTLPTGQKVIVKEMKDNPIVTISTWVKTGSVNENDENSGVAHFLEHLFFKGSKNVPTGEFDKILESKGGVTNAATSKDYTQFYITIPSKDFDTALKLHSDMLLRPLIPSKELEKERFVVMEEISRGMDSPSQIAYNNLFKLIYSTDNLHPYRRPVIGTKEIISSIPREKILEFYNKWYVPSNMITVVSGDIDGNYALQEITKAFETENINENKIQYPAINPITKRISISETKNINQGHLLIGYKAPKAEINRDVYALDVLAVILGGSESSTLYRNLKEKEEIVTGIGAGFSQYAHDGLFIINATFTPDKNELDIEQEIYTLINKVKAGEITKEEVAKAKTILRTNTEYQRQTTSNVAEELGFAVFYYNGPKLYDEYLKQINKVELKDVLRVANKYLNNDKTAVSAVLPPKKEHDVANISYAAKITPVEKKILEKTDSETKYLLDNNSTLVIRKNKQNSIIAINITGLGGAFLSDKPAVPYLALASAKKGTKSFDKEELNSFLDQKGIILSTTAYNDMAQVSLTVTKENFNDGIKILDEVINHPTFQTSEIENVKKDYTNYAKTLQDRSLSYAIDDFTGEAFKGYPYSNNAEKVLKSFNDVTREDIKNYYNKVFDSKNVIITVVGDVDEDSMISEFSNMFKDKGEKKAEIKNYLKQSYIPKETYKKRLDSDGKEASWILVGYKIGDIYNLKENATAKVINSIMGSGMSSRLFRELRENQGLAYQVGSQIRQYGNDGAYVAYIGTNPKNEQIALNGILKEINKLKTEFVPTKELNEAKDKLSGNIILSLETNKDRADLLSRNAAYGYDLEYLDKLQKEIENVTSSDIVTFANKYFSNPHFEIIVGQ